MRSRCGHGRSLRFSGRIRVTILLMCCIVIQANTERAHLVEGRHTTPRIFERGCHVSCSSVPSHLTVLFLRPSRLGSPWVTGPRTQFETSGHTR